MSQAEGEGIGPARERQADRLGRRDRLTDSQKDSQMTCRVDKLDKDKRHREIYRTNRNTKFN